MIFVRHGFSVANAEERFAGHSDFPLDAVGHAQARCVAEYITKNEKHIDAVYSSGLLRTTETVLPTAEALGMPVLFDLGLREIFAGDWEGLKFSEIHERYRESFDTWLHDLANVRCDGGESIEELFARVTSAVCALGEANDGKTLLLATHATPLRVIECFSDGDSYKEIASHKSPPNASIHIYRYENGALTPEKKNIVSHLEGMITKLPDSV